LTHTGDSHCSSLRPLSPELTVFTIKTSNPDQWPGPLFNERGEVVAIADSERT
jgi:hypothetical protein